MFVFRWIATTKRGQAGKVAEIIGRARGKKGFGFPESVRIYSSALGVSDRVCMELPMERYGEFDTLFASLAANPPPWFAEVDPLLENRDISETWEVVQ